MEWITIWWQIRKMFFVLSFLLLERPVLGLLIYFCIFLTAVVSTWICWKHFRGGRKVAAGFSLMMAGTSWWAFFLSLIILVDTIFWIARQ